MKRAGAKDIKQHWSEYLRRVEAGETVVITRRGRPVVKMVPMETRSEVDDLEGLARALERQGVAVRRPKRSLKDRQRHLRAVLRELRAGKPLCSPGTAQALLDEDRAERT